MSGYASVTEHYSLKHLPARGVCPAQWMIVDENNHSCGRMPAGGSEAQAAAEERCRRLEATREGIIPAVKEGAVAAAAKKRFQDEALAAEIDWLVNTLPAKPQQVALILKLIQDGYHEGCRMVIPTDYETISSLSCREAMAMISAMRATQ